MKRTKSTPHDAFLKLLLDDTRNAKDFFLHMLPKALTRRLDLDSLTPENASFVSPSLKATFSDAIFSVRLRNQNQQSAIISILLEHKSHPDKWAAVQLLTYLANGYRRQARDAHKTKAHGGQNSQSLRPIIPFLFYQGGKPWIFRGIHDLFDQVYSPLLHYVPAFETIYTSLRDMDDNHIAKIAEAWLRAALLTQKYSYNPLELIQRLEPILRSVKEAMDGNFFLTLSIYISSSLHLEPEEFKLLVESLPSELKTQAMETLYDKIMAKGRQEGRQEGTEIAKKEAVLSGYRHGISVEVICLMTGYSEEKVLEILREIHSDNT